MDKYKEQIKEVLTNINKESWKEFCKIIDEISDPSTLKEVIEYSLTLLKDWTLNLRVLPKHWKGTEETVLATAEEIDLNPIIEKYIFMSSEFEEMMHNRGGPLDGIEIIEYPAGHYVSLHCSPYIPEKRVYKVKLYSGYGCIKFCPKEEGYLMYADEHNLYKIRYGPETLYVSGN